ALVAYDRALALNSSPEEAAYLWRNKALANRCLAHDEMALACAEEAITLLPTLGHTWSEKARVLYALGRFEEALAAAEESMRLQPADASVSELQSFLQHALRRTIPDRFLTLRDGRRLAYLDFGGPAGFPILCCHGTPGSRLDFAVGGEPPDELHVRLIVPDR